MNKKIIWGVIIAVIALGGLLLYKYTGIFGPIIQLYSKNSSETSNWKTYTNREYVFTFKYPNDWLVTENASEGEIVAVTPPVNSANQRINRFSVGVLPSPESDRSTSDYGCKESPWKDVADLYKSDFKLEMTKCISLNEYISLTTSNEEMKVTLEKILSTFKTTSTTNSVTSNWKTYTNNELGYSIKYPANYKITDNNVLASNKFVSAISLQISDPVNKAIEFNPLLTVDIIKQPYIVKDKIFINAKEYANSRYEGLQNLSIVEKVKGDPSIVEVSGMTQSEVSSELLQFKMLVGINNGLIYEVSYYPVDYRLFYEIADTFKFTSPTNAELSKEQKLISTSREVLTALKNKDYNKLETLSSKDGLSFNEYPDSLDLNKNDISKSAISEIPTNTIKYMWGYTDGKGDEIRLTVSDYINQWIYNRDYINAPKIVVNQIAYPQGNTPNNISTYSQGRNYVAFHFDGFDPKYGGMDWTTMYLIFDEENGNYMLRGIIKANWTI